MTDKLVSVSCHNRTGRDTILTGYTGNDKLATVRIEERRWHLPCSCGGSAWIWEYGSMYQHSEPLDIDAEHIISPFWREEIWKYELVE